MSFPKYVDFKDSGVAWLGQIPRHWSLPKIKHIASFTGGGTPSRDNLAFWGGPIPWVSPKDMKVQEICEAEESITDLGLLNSSASIVERGHVLLVVRSGILKHTIPVAINVVAVALNQDMKALRFDPQRCTSSFFSRWVQGLNDQLLLAWAKQGATVESIEHGYMAESIIPLPPLGEQVAIDRFLDHETSKIDALVEEQRRLIELLKEERQAVISQAVTKGLNPNVPMKDSGVEWLGKVPAHWEVLKAAHIGTLFGSDQIEESMITDAGALPFIKVASLDGDGFSIRSWDWFVDSSIEHLYKPKAHFLVFPKRGAAIFLNKVNVVDRPALIDPNLMGWEMNGKAISHFMAFCLKVRRLDELADVSTVPQINNKHIYPERFPVPPTTEQAAIADFIGSALAQIDALMEEAATATNLLHERRSALISAAVTGKIDVRGLVPQPEAIAA